MISERFEGFLLEDKFFKDFHMDIGNSCKCPKCGGMIDMSHPAVNRGVVGSSPTRGVEEKPVNVYVYGFFA